MDLDPALDLEEPDTDVRYVAVVWRNEDDSGPNMMCGGCSDFEAAGLLRAALRRLERSNASSVLLDDEVDEDDEGDSP